MAKDEGIKQETPVTVSLANGKQYTLSNISTAQCREIYEKDCTPEQRQEADQIAQMLSTYRAVAEIARSKGLEPVALIRSWVSAGGKAVEGINEKTGEAFTEINQKLGDLGVTVDSVAEWVPGGSGMLETARNAEKLGKAVAVAGNSAIAGIDGLINTPARLFDGVVSLAKIGYSRAVDGGEMSPEAARAFAVATVLLRQEAKESREGESFWANPLGRIKAGLQWGMQWLSKAPVLSWIPATVAGGWEWMTNWEKDKPSFAESCAKAHEENMCKPTLTYAELLNGHSEEADAVRVAEKLRAAKTIGGLDTTRGLADVATLKAGESATLIDKDGNTVKLDGQNASLAQTVESFGKTVYKHTVAPVIGDGPIYEQSLRAVGGVASLSVLHNAAKGAASMFINPNTLTPAGGGFSGWAHSRPSFLGTAPGQANSPIFGNLAKLSERGMSVGRWIGEVGAKTVDLSVAPFRAAGRGLASGLARTIGAFSTYDAATNKLVHHPERSFGSTKLGATGKAFAWAAPIWSFAQAVDASDKGNTEESVIRGTETVGMGMTLAKMGMRRGVPVVGAIWSGADLISAGQANDMRGVTTSLTSLGTMGSFVLAGSFLGPAGWLAGLGVGGLVSIATSLGAGALYDRINKPAAPGQPTILTPEELLAGERTVREQARGNAQQVAGKLTMCNSRIVGGVTLPDGQCVQPSDTKYTYVNPLSQFV